MTENEVRHQTESMGNLGLPFFRLRVCIAAIYVMITYICASEYFPQGPSGVKRANRTDSTDSEFENLPEAGQELTLSPEPTIHEKRFDTWRTPTRLNKNRPTSGERVRHNRMGLLFSLSVLHSCSLQNGH
jgi:hypothetical protein